MSRLGPVRAILALAMLVAPSTRVAHADWAQTTGPSGGFVRSFVAVPGPGGGTDLFAGGLRVWRTGDHGASWTHLVNGLTDPNAFTLVAVPNGSGGNDLFAGTNAGVFRSSDHGESWISVSNGLTNPSIYALASGSNGSGGTNLYAGAFMGNAFRSTDRGASWTPIQTGLPTGYNVNAIITTSSGTVLAGTMNGIYRSTNFGASWTRVFTLFGLSLARHGSTLYAGSSNGVHRSTDDGATWTPINGGMGFTWIYAVAAIPSGSGVTLFAGAGYVLRSTDNGASWQVVNNGFPTIGVRAFATIPNASGGTDLYAGTGDGVFCTSNSGNNWTNVSFISSSARALEVTPGGAVLAGTENDVFRSTDGGANWTDTQSTTTALDFAVNLHGTGGPSIFLGGSPAGIYKSQDDGVTWGQSSNGLDDFDVNSIAAVPNGTGGTNLVAGTYSGIFISRNDGGFWQRTNSSDLPLDYLVVPNGSGGHNVYAAGFGGVIRSTDGGGTWTTIGLFGKVVSTVEATGGGAALFAAGDAQGVYRSTDGGANWTLVNNGLADLRVYELLSPDGANLFAAGSGGVFLTTDNGNSWSAVGAGLTAGVGRLAVSPDGTTLLAGAGGYGVWKRPLAEMLGGAPPPPPITPPSISSFTPASGAPGTEVTIAGSNFAGATAVTFNLTPAATFAVVSGTQVRATVPTGASTGRIRVTTPAGTGTSGSDFVVPLPPPPLHLTFAPPHDAYVRSNSQTSNFGSRPELTARGGSTRLRSYLKFDVSGVAGTVQSATLRLRVTDAGPDGGAVSQASNHFAGTSTPWTESGLTWRNAPTISGDALDAVGSVSVGTWVEFDVTAAIAGNGTFSFVITSGSSNQVDYSSSEGPNPPQLVVVASGSETAVAAAVAAPPRVEATVSTRALAAPDEMVLHAGHPNPFDTETTIRFALPRAMPVRLVIYDVSGRAVRTLLDGVQGAGERRAVWDGRDDGGARVRAGLYVYRLEADGRSLTHKLSLLR